MWGSLSGTIGRASHSLISDKGCMEHKRSGRPAEITVASLSVNIASPHNTLMPPLLSEG